MQISAKRRTGDQRERTIGLIDLESVNGVSGVVGDIQESSIWIHDRKVRVAKASDLARKRSCGEGPGRINRSDPNVALVVRVIQILAGGVNDRLCCADTIGRQRTSGRQVWTRTRADRVPL